MGTFPESFGSMIVRRAIPALLATAAMLAIPVVSPAQSAGGCGGIQVEILGLHSSDGKVACALFDSSDGFPREVLPKAEQSMRTKIHGQKASCDFVGVAPGTYAVGVFHDEDANGKLNTNLLGIPQEGYSFSNDAKGTLGPPSFSAASFDYKGGSLQIKVTIHY